MSHIAKMIAIAKSVVNNALHPAPVVILPETEFKKESGMTIQFEIQAPLSATPVEGKTYAVTVDGVAYESPAIRYEMEGIEMFAMGNASLVGLEGGVADAPYAVMLYPAGIPDDIGTAYGSLHFPDGEFRDHATLSIVEAAETESAGGGGTFIVHGTTADMQSVTLVETPEEAMAAAQAGQHVDCHLTMSVGDMTMTYVLPMLTYGEVTFGPDVAPVVGYGMYMPGCSVQISDGYNGNTNGIVERSTTIVYTED